VPSDRDANEVVPSRALTNSSRLSRTVIRFAMTREHVPSSFSASFFPSASNTSTAYDRRTHVQLRGDFEYDP